MTWTKSDSDVPWGAVGQVLGPAHDGKLQVRFNGNDFNFRPEELHLEGEQTGATGAADEAADMIARMTVTAIDGQPTGAAAAAAEAPAEQTQPAAVVSPCSPLYSPSSPHIRLVLPPVSGRRDLL